MQLEYMYNKIKQKLGIGLILIVIISIHIFIIIGNSFFLKQSISKIEDDATLINQSGKIRGGIQRVIKLELENKDTKEHIEKIDFIIEEFIFKKKYHLLDNEMESFILKITKLNKEWKELKELIKKYQKDKTILNKEKMINKSEYLWEISEDTLMTVSRISKEKTNVLNNTFLIFFIDLILIIFIIYIINKKIRNKLEILSSVDSLTNTKNRNTYNESLKYELELRKRYENNIAYIILDIDKFKDINDTFGHDIGDIVLRELAEIIKKSIRESDMFFRIGGEEFALFIKEIKEEDLEKLANKIRKNVADFRSELTCKFTISIGATMFKSDDTKESIFKRADEALYESKNSGRNKVTIV